MTRHAPLTPEMRDRVAAQFRALGEPARLTLLELLLEGEMGVNELAGNAGLSHANASKHLTVLLASGYLLRRKEGTKVLYALADDTPRALCAIVCDRVRLQAERELRRVRAR